MATVIDSGRRVFSNLKYLYFTPWTDEAKLGEVTYDLVNIVGDTTSSEQDENEVNEIAHEFSNEPLYENINLGKKNFSTECIDFQNDVVKQLFGWTVDESGNAFAPITYKPLYCKVEMGFNSTDDVIVLPKVKLNSRAVIASMKTDAAKGNITGTCYSAYVKAGDTEQETDMAIISSDHQEDYTVSASASTSDGGGGVTISLSATSVTSNSIALTATCSEESADYYEWSLNGDIESTETPTKTYSALTANTTYYIKVRARYENESGVDVYTSWVSKTFTTPATT